MIPFVTNEMQNYVRIPLLLRQHHNAARGLLVSSHVAHEAI